MFVAGWLATARAEAPANSSLKSENFDHDPGWESYNNRIVPGKTVTVTQDFGYSPTNFAGESKGELGGVISRCSVAAFSVDLIPPKTLDDRLSASGTFALKSTSGGWVFFGWHNAKQLRGSGDPESFGLLMLCEKAGGRIAVRLHTRLNKSCGTFVTPYIPGRYRPTPIRPDGTRYRWKMDYDPQGNSGDGQFQVSVEKVDKSQPADDFEGLTYTVKLPPGFRKEGATFDRFGLCNTRKAGGSVTIYFDDLQYDGKREDFSTPPNSWDEAGNRGEVREPMQPGAHDFGFSADTSFAGSKPGEAGGCFWRVEKTFGTYADRVGPLTLDDRIEASGKVVLQSAVFDSDMAFGWFNSARGERSPAAANFLGVQVGGPTRAGHMFAPLLVTGKGDRTKAEKAPTLAHGQPYDWSLVYDPTANNGNGSVRVTLGEESLTLNLKPGQKREGAIFDRFGMVSLPPGGSLVNVYLDSLTYTARRP